MLMERNGRNPAGLRLYPVLLCLLAVSLCSSCQQDQRLSRKPDVKRYGSVIGVKAEKLEEYKRLHAAVWPDVLKMIDQCHIRNYSIYLRKMPDGQHYLFSYFEYTGGDFAADMAKMAADPATQKWWAVCEPCQVPLKDRADGQWWADMEEVFHFDGTK